MTVRNLRTAGLEQGGVRIDRATEWGNPFRIGEDGTREEVIAKYRKALWLQIKSGNQSLEQLAALKGKDLYCWCAPEACHGDVLQSAARWASEELARKVG